MNVLYGLNTVKKEVSRLKPSKVIIVVSRTIQRLHKKVIDDISKNIGVVQVLAVKDGEDLKTWLSIEELLNKFLKIGLDRKSLVIAIGGGSVGDAIGFASSIYLRGIKYINIPTTLLAQVDSAHGGKTGINFGTYKNQIGTFHESAATIIDPVFISTLPKEEIVSGLGEIIKAGYIAAPSILNLLKKETITSIVKSKNLLKIIKKSIEVKRHCATEDLYDKGIRQLLNVGHTVSHAIELKYNLSHGRAVIIGMLEEFRMSESQGLSKKGLAESLSELLGSLGIEIEKNLVPSWSGVSKDKKVSSDSLEWPVVIESGKAELVKISLKDFRNIY